MKAEMIYCMSTNLSIAAPPLLRPAGPLAWQEPRYALLRSAPQLCNHAVATHFTQTRRIEWPTIVKYADNGLPTLFWLSTQYT